MLTHLRWLWEMTSIRSLWANRYWTEGEMNNLSTTFWSPLALAIASGAFGIFWESRNGWDATAILAGSVFIAAVLFAYIAAKRTRNIAESGAGGNATASGEDSDAIGGDAGRSIGGGRGGDAVATGTRARAKGGHGGDA